MNLADFGNELAKIRKAKGYTQTELAEKCSISCRTIQRIESGKVTPRFFTIKALSNALDFDFLNEISSNLSKNDTVKPQSYILKNKIISKTIDLFNLKRNTMKKLSFLTVVLGLISLGLFTISNKSNAQDNLKLINCLTIESNEAISKKDAIKIIEQINDKVNYHNGAIKSIKSYAEKSEFNFDTYIHLSKLIASFGHSSKSVLDIAEIVFATQKDYVIFKDVASLIFLNEGSEVSKYIHLAKKIKESNSDTDFNKIKIEIENFKSQSKYKTLEEAFKNQN